MSTLVLLFTGAGGCRKFIQSFKKKCHASGQAVEIFNTFTYFLWRKRTPEETTQEVINRLKQFNFDKLLLIGYSQGADILPFISSRLPIPIKDKISLITFINLSPVADFHLRLRDILSNLYPVNALDVTKEMEKISKIKKICIHGKNDTSDKCPHHLVKNFEHFEIEGRHILTNADPVFKIIKDNLFLNDSHK